MISTKVRKFTALYTAVMQGGTAAVEKVFNVRNDLSACCEDEGEIGTDRRVCNCKPPPPPTHTHTFA